RKRATHRCPVPRRSPQGERFGPPPTTYKAQRTQRVERNSVRFPQGFSDSSCHGIGRTAEWSATAIPPTCPRGGRTVGIFENTLSACCFAEVLGTYILIFFGCGAVHAAVLTGAQAGLWQVAIVWGVAIMLAVYVVGGISGAHINPAITVALATWGRFSWKEVLPYIARQLAGALRAAGNPPSGS